MCVFAFVWLALLIQATGSFKERGARNALLKLSPEAKKLGVVVASAGNHALALAHHGAKLGIPVTVVMPRAAVFCFGCFLRPLRRQAKCKSEAAVNNSTRRMRKAYPRESTPSLKNDC